MATAEDGLQTAELDGSKVAEELHQILALDKEFSRLGHCIGKNQVKAFDVPMLVQAFYSSPAVQGAQPKI